MVKKACLDNVWDYYWNMSGDVRNLEKSSLEYKGKCKADDINLEVTAYDLYLKLGVGESWGKLAEK